MNTNEHDVIIVGGGAAGLSAALVLSRARRRVVVVDAGAPRNAPAAQMQGFLSRDGMPPSELLAAGRAEVVAYGAEIVTATVQQLLAADSTDAPAFVARLADGTTLHGRRVLVTTGLSDELPDIPGLRDRWARDVLHCPYCHGYEVRDQRLGVVWNGPMTPAYAQIVRQWSHDVVLLAPPTTLTDQQRTELLARAIGIVESPVTGVEVCDDRLTGVTLADGTTLRRDALFVPPRFTPHSDLLVQLGCDLDDDGWVITAAHGATSVAGVRVAGNVSNPRAQVITAAGEGSAAAIALNADLVDEDVRLAVRDLGQHAWSEPTPPHRVRHDAGPDPKANAMSESTSTSATQQPRPATSAAPQRVGPPSKHALALMIWLCVFPTLTVINLALGDWLRPMAPVLRTFVLATIAVPIVIYGLMPQLHKVRGTLALRSVR